MNRPSTLVGVAAVSLVLLAGCGGKDSEPGAACRDRYVDLYEKAVQLLTESSPSDPGIDDKMKDVLGGGVPKDCKDNPSLANRILQQVERDYDSRLAALEGKWGAANISGFRDPMNAGHGDPVGHDRPTPGTPEVPDD